MGFGQANAQDRVKSAIGVAAFHALLGYVLVTSLGFEVGAGRDEPALKLFDVPRALPPPIEPPAPIESRAEEGEAAPPNIKSEAAPIVAPPPEVRLKVPPPVVAAPVRADGPDRSAGAATLPGPGTGAGGFGDGFGSGDAGNGTGAGGAATRAWLVAGHLSTRDFPRAFRRSGIGGTVHVRYLVRENGRASGCMITRSSGFTELDMMTCRLIERRHRYEPARDRIGRPVAESVFGFHEWVPSRREAWDDE